MDRPQSKQVLLIADANPKNISVLKTMLSPDYDIKFAADGEHAIKLALSPDTPGLILLNIMMPSVDMYEVCRKLKADKTTKEIPIILLSEPTPEDTEAKGFELGAADYITMPFKRSVVKARIRQQRSDKLIHFCSGKLRRSFTQQQKESLTGSRYPAPECKTLPRLLLLTPL